MDNDAVRSAVLEAIEASLSAQIKAVRSLRTQKAPDPRDGAGSGAIPRSKGKSQVAMTIDILTEAGRPLHVTDIIARIANKFSVTVDRESLVSALTKRIKRKDRLVRTEKNTFGLIGADNPHHHL